MSRDAIMAKIRTALGREKSVDEERAQRVGIRLSNPPRAALPASLASTGAGMNARLRQRLAANGIDVIDVKGAGDAPAAVAAYLDAHGMPRRLSTDGISNVSAAALREAGLDIRSGPPEDGPSTTLSPAIAAIAETGTLVLTSGSDHRTASVFLTETHIIVVDAAAVVASLEDGLDAVRRSSGGNAVPRTINLVSAPSRTGDIGGRIVNGAHGPIRVAVILVGTENDQGATGAP